MRFFICTPPRKKRALQKMERPRVLHIFLRSCQQELNNIIYLRIQIYVSVCPLKPEMVAMTISNSISVKPLALL